MNRNDHPTAEMIHQELSLLDPHLSLATVYRNLNSFVMKGKIRKIEIPNAKDRYDWKMMQHDHALCMSCGCLMDVPPIKSKKIKEIDGFKVQEVNILYKGKCQACQKKDN